MTFNPQFYDNDIDVIRRNEYPMLSDTIYLDHSGTTLYAKSLVDKFSSSMISGLYGNPHSNSVSSIFSLKKIDDVRLKALQFFGADPEDFDIVFVANATAAIKVVAEGFRARGGFDYGYHRDSHTSLVGVRELAVRSKCFISDEYVGKWLRSSSQDLERPFLFAYPAQSNMNGRRLPLSWSKEIRAMKQNTYTVLDAAAYVSTSPLDLSNADNAPDFTALSFYKIFGFPDLGALVVRKSSGHMLTRRAYFGGGTVETVSCLQEQWHATKDTSLHEQLEDGTLPIHSILALDLAFDVHINIYQSMQRISQHTAHLANRLFLLLTSLRHDNGQQVCNIFATPGTDYTNTRLQGPVLAFNVRAKDGTWVSNSELEKLASVRNIHLRTGRLCSPGAIAYHLNLKPMDLMKNYTAGLRCGNDQVEECGKPTGVIRVSFGAMSSSEDVTTITEFLREFYAQKEDAIQETPSICERPTLSVESLTIYPIKSCGGYSVPANWEWEVLNEGLAWDREWCLIHAGTRQVLSQNRYPRMALLKPEMDLKSSLLRVRFAEPGNSSPLAEISVSLLEFPEKIKPHASNVCNEAVEAVPYRSDEISTFFTSALGVPCYLAHFPANGTGLSSRRSKAHLQQHQTPGKRKINEIRYSSSKLPSPLNDVIQENIPRPILLSNESPILSITRASLDFLNAQIRHKNGKLADASVFRANIVIASSAPSSSVPYIESSWGHVKIGEEVFEMLGSCRRCSMVCVDQATAIKDEEPFVTLAKTRRFDNKVFFGEHMCHISRGRRAYISVGDPIEPFNR